MQSVPKTEIAPQIAEDGEFVEDSAAPDSAVIKTFPERTGKLWWDLRKFVAGSRFALNLLAASALCLSVNKPDAGREVNTFSPQVAAILTQLVIVTLINSLFGVYHRRTHKQVSIPKWLYPCFLFLVFTVITPYLIFYRLFNADWNAFSAPYFISLPIVTFVLNYQMDWRTRRLVSKASLAAKKKKQVE